MTQMTPERLTAQLRALGLAEGSLVVVHTAFKTVGPVDGGPAGLIAALRAALGPAGTLVMPSMTDDDDHPFDPATTPCAGMGIVADTFWRQPGVLRSHHYASFAAAGPLAPVITADHPAAPPHGIDSPVGRVAALGGLVLLLGIDHSSSTTLHVAESLAAVPYRARRHFTVDKGGVLTRVDYEETDHCCQGFARLDGWLRARGLQRDGSVGHGAARLMRAADVVRIAVEELRRDPFALLHARGQCVECDEAWASVDQR